MTIYDNDRPFGLMSKIDQDAMKAHHAGGGYLVYYNAGGYWTKITPLWVWDTTYRAVKAPPKPITVLVMDALPDWPSIWLAKDSWGNVHASSANMLRHHSGWNPQSGAKSVDIPGDPLRIVDGGDIDWKDSLIRVK